MDAILDTSVIVELFKGNRSVIEKLSRDLVYGISVITLFELHCGTLKEREEIFLEKMPKLSYDADSAKLAGKIYRELKRDGRVPKVKDLLIASSAIASDKILITRDSDFEIFKKIEISKILKKLKFQNFDFQIFFDRFFFSIENLFDRFFFDRNFSR